MISKNNINKIFTILSNNFINGGEGFELKYINSYTLLVATILSAQMTDKGVNKATEELFKIVDTPEKMIQLGEDKLKTYIKSVNYFNTKAKNIIKMSSQLIKNFNSQIPSTLEELITLAGVGRKTANCILIYIFNKKAIAVDTHVIRVSNRLGLINEKNPLLVELQLLKIIPDKYINLVNQNFVHLGRYICKAQKPQCDCCPLTKICEFFQINYKN